MDEADEELLEKMVRILNANREENWVDLHNLRVIKYGSILHVDCHLTVPWYLNVNEAHAEIEALGSLIKKRVRRITRTFCALRWLFVCAMPDLFKIRLSCPASSF